MDPSKQEALAGSNISFYATVQSNQNQIKLHKYAE